MNETGFQLKADSRLKELNATFRVKNPDKRFTELRHYSDELQSVISHLLRVRAVSDLALCDIPEDGACH